MKKQVIITFEQVQEWLGTSSPEVDAIETLVDIANGGYAPEMFKNDILATVS
jgi:hypothetical protein